MNGTTSAIRVRTRYGDVDDFVVGYSAFFDARGIFIRTRRLQEVGSKLRFELQLADGSSVFRGEGVVDEVREPPRSASGMHVRITKLDRDSKLLFERITAERNAEVAGKAPSEPLSGRPSIVLGGAAAEPRPTTRPDIAMRPPSGPIELFEDVPSGRTDLPQGPSGRQELSGDLLGEIADGIEMTLDSVLLSGPVDPTGASELGGFFGSPAELAAASGQHAAILGAPTSAPAPPTASSPLLAAASVADQLAAFEADLAAESGEQPALSLDAGDPFEHQTNADAVFEHSLSDQFPLPPQDEAAPAFFDVPSDQAAPPARELPPPAHDLPPPARELPRPLRLPPREDHLPLTGEPAQASDQSEDLGLGDVSLAIASNLQFTPQAGVDAVSLFAATDQSGDSGAAEVVEGEAVDEEGEEEDEEVFEGVAEPSGSQAAAPAERPTSREVPLAVAAAAKPHFRLKDEGGPALDDLLLDILEENRSPVVTSSGNIPALLVGSSEDGDEGGPDAIDELLARESAEQDSLGKKKKGFFSRLFGRK